MNAMPLKNNWKLVFLVTQVNDVAENVCSSPLTIYSLLTLTLSVLNHWWYFKESYFCLTFMVTSKTPVYVVSHSNGYCQTLRCSPLQPLFLTFNKRLFSTLFLKISTGKQSFLRGEHLLSLAQMLQRHQQNQRIRWKAFLHGRQDVLNNEPRYCGTLLHYSILAGCKWM